MFEFDLSGVGNEEISLYYEASPEDEVSRKDSAKSVEVRKRGNDLYASQDHSVKIHCRILSLYNLSAALAESDSEELALAYGNRSALLMHLGKYRECLADVERADPMIKSEKLKLKLEERRVKCLTLVGVENSDCIPPIPPKKIITKPSKTIPCASELVSLRFDEKYGRHIVAAHDIEPGTVIAAEHGFLFPRDHKRYLNCSHCFNFAWNGVPCESCAFIIYCSEKCKNEAWLQYHDDECKILPHLNDLKRDGDTLIHIMLTIRILIKLVKEEGLENIIKQANEIDTKKNTNLDLFFKKGLFQCYKFKTIYNLSCELYNVKKGEYLFLEKLYNILIRETIIFKNDRMDDCFKKSIFKIILKLKCIVDNNSYSFQHVKSNGSMYGGDNLSSKYVIGDIFTSFCSFFNHNCDNNVERVFRDKQILLYTSNYVKKGQQLFVNYGPDTSIIAQERKNYLFEKYNFHCNCDPCKSNWSMEIYNPKECNDQIIRRLVSIFLKIGTNETFMNLCDYSQSYKISENILNDVRKMIKAVNKNFDDFSRIIISVYLKNYIHQYFGNIYGRKLDIPGKC